MYDEYEVNDYMQNSPELTIVPTRNLVRQEVGTLTIAERAELPRRLFNWEYTSEGNLQRIWQFDDFPTAFGWLNRVGSICCERIGHRAQFSLNIVLGQSGTTMEAKVLLGLSHADGELAALLELEDPCPTPWRLTSLG